MKDSLGGNVSTILTNIEKGKNNNFDILFFFKSGKDTYVREYQSKRVQLRRDLKQLILRQQSQEYCQR